MHGFACSRRVGTDQAEEEQREQSGKQDEEVKKQGGAGFDPVHG
jgi:hypothetical protein